MTHEQDPPDNRLDGGDVNSIHERGFRAIINGLRTTPEGAKKQSNLANSLEWYEFEAQSVATSTARRIESAPTPVKLLGGTAAGVALASCVPNTPTEVITSNQTNPLGEENSVNEMEENVEATRQATGTPPPGTPTSERVKPGLTPEEQQKIQNSIVSQLVSGEESGVDFNVRINVEEDLRARIADDDGGDIESIKYAGGTNSKGDFRWAAIATTSSGVSYVAVLDEEDDRGFRKFDEAKIVGDNNNLRVRRDHKYNPTGEEGEERERVVLQIKIGDEWVSIGGLSEFLQVGIDVIVLAETAKANGETINVIEELGLPEIPENGVPFIPVINALTGGKYLYEELPGNPGIPNTDKEPAYILVDGVWVTTAVKTTDEQTTEEPTSEREDINAMTTETPTTEPTEGLTATQEPTEEITPEPEGSKWYENLTQQEMAEIVQNSERLEMESGVNVPLSYIVKSKLGEEYIAAVEYELHPIILDEPVLKEIELNYTLTNPDGTTETVTDNVPFYVLPILLADQYGQYFVAETYMDQPGYWGWIDHKVLDPPIITRLSSGSHTMEKTEIVAERLIPNKQHKLFVTQSSDSGDFSEILATFLEDMEDGVLEQVKKFYALAFHQKYGARTISILDGILNGSLSATSITDIPKLVYMVGAHTNSSD